MSGGIDQIPGIHSHVFLGAGHEKNERKTWAVIALCSTMMVAEIVGGSLFGSLAVVADGLHMSTHAAAMLIAALAYTYARRHANDSSFAFGTGKLGDLAGYSSAIILAMIALLIGYEAVSRFIHPVPIDYDEAIAIAVVGLLVNIASAWLLSGGDHGHSHGHGHSHHHDHHHEDDARRIDTGHGFLLLEVYEDGVPPRFRVRFEGAHGLMPVPGGQSLTVETVRPDGKSQTFAFANRGGYLESVDEIPEPHEFVAHVRLSHGDHAHAYELAFSEDGHDHAAPGGGAHRDNNMRAAFVHVIADAAVSVLAILGLLLAKYMGWTFMDPAMGVVGMLVIANWSYGLVRDTGGILLDRLPDEAMATNIRKEIEQDGDQLTDLHIWRLGPGHLGAIVSVATTADRDAEFYRARLGRFDSLSHVTVEVRQAA